MVEHDSSGSVGFVLNKPLPYTTSELVKELEGVHFPVYIGGPVERNQLETATPMRASPMSSAIIRSFMSLYSAYFSAPLPATARHGSAVSTLCATSITISGVTASMAAIVFW